MSQVQPDDFYDLFPEVLEAINVLEPFRLPSGNVRWTAEVAYQVLLLLSKSGLPMAEFAYRCRVSAVALAYFRKGRCTRGNWPELQALIGDKPLIVGRLWARTVEQRRRAERAPPKPAGDWTPKHGRTKRVQEILDVAARSKTFAAAARELGVSYQRVSEVVRKHRPNWKSDPPAHAENSLPSDGGERDH